MIILFKSVVNKNKNNYYYNVFLEKGSNHTCIAIISLDSALKRDENYHLKVFLKECKYIEKKVIRYINDNLSDFSSDDDESDKESMFSLKNT